MLLNFTIKELKMLSESLARNKENYDYDWEEREEYEILQEKIDKEIDYYDFATQED